MMNNRIKELIDQCTHTVTDYSLCIDSSVEVFDKEKFATLIIQECMNNPKVYLLYKMDNTSTESSYEIIGWTHSLKLVHQWCRSSTPNEAHDFHDLYFMSHIKSL